MRNESTRKIFASALVFFALVTLVRAQCMKSQDHRRDKNGGIIVEHVELTGTRAVSSEEIAEITANIAGSCFDESDDEIGFRIKDLFQQHGYFMATVDNVTFKTIDPLATPKPVNIEAEAIEGPLYRLSAIRFVGNHVFTAQRLRSQFPLKPGDVFNTERARSALDALRHLYGSEGYLDFVPVPETETRSDGAATLVLKIQIVEGTQYRMGKLKIIGEEPQASPMQARWGLEEGAPFDALYPDKFLKDNKSLFPDGFERDAVRVVRNCKEATVSVSIVLDATKFRGEPAAEVGCYKQPDDPKT